MSDVILNEFEQLVEIYGESVQDLEESMFELEAKRILTNAEGVQLDKWGNILNEPRRGRNDSDYRAALGIAIVRNTGSGEPETIIQVMKFITGSTNLEYTELYPAGFRVVFDGDTISNKAANDSLEAIKPAGVAYELVKKSDEEDVKWFGFKEKGGLVPDDIGHFNEKGTTDPDDGLFTERIA